MGIPSTHLPSYLDCSVQDLCPDHRLVLCTPDPKVSTFPHDLQPERFEIFSERVPDIRGTSQDDTNGPVIHRYSIDDFDSLVLGSMQHEALRLRHVLRFATVSGLAAPHLQSMFDELLERVRLARELKRTEAIGLQRSSLDAYVCSTQASVSELVARRFVTSKLHAAKSVGHLIDFLFSLQNRIPPPFSTLVWECDQRRLLSSTTTDTSAVANAVDLFLPENIISTLTHIADGHINPQATAFAAVEELAMQHGLVDVLRQWSEQQLKTLRPVGRPPRKYGASDPATRKMVAFINRVHGLDYTLSHRLDGGWSAGAYLLQPATPPSVIGSGTPIRDLKTHTAVLKWNSNKSWAPQVLQAAPLIARACAAGYPTPPWIVFGVSPSGYPYQVQAFAAGTPVKTVDLEVIEAMLPIFDIQRGFQPENTFQNWTAHDMQLVFESDELHNRLASATDAATRELHTALMEWVQPCATSTELTTEDLVHGDLNPTNILLDGSDEGLPAIPSDPTTPRQLPGPTFRVSIVDSESLGRGSVLHDVATLLLAASRQHSSDAVERLVEYAVYGVQRSVDFHLAIVAHMLCMLSHDGQQSVVECHTLLRHLQISCCSTH